MTQTSIFSDVRLIPESGREVVLNMVTGQIISPAIYSRKLELFKCPAGIVRPYMIKSWAYLDDVNQALGLEAIDQETLGKLNQQAEDEKCKCDIPNQIIDMVLKDFGDVLPDFIKKDLQEMKSNNK
ncbi:hypothetical protein DCO44_09850 [Acinetobacter sp. AM]|uniref:hypothetical protein n=1 Tax=Acinetobacter sp. AM TaxID=2170730 RepID=UPI000DE5CE29|nr:hypothetical protein [Acinetobacter sp. AM]PWB14206.1 hypothetical protein DCO44_09850 [Acinetobacter sp. AM]